MAKFSQSVLDFVGGIGGNVLAQELVFDQRSFWNLTWRDSLQPSIPPAPIDLTNVTIDAQIVRRSITNFRDSRQGLVFDINNYPLTPVATTVFSAENNRFTAESTEQLFVGKPITFGGTAFGGVLEGTVYYVFEIYNQTQFSITDTPNGGIFTLTDNTGFMEVFYIKPTPIPLTITNRNDPEGRFTLVIDSQTWAILKGDRDLNIDGTPACFTGRIRLSFPSIGSTPEYDETIFLLFLIYSDGVVNYE